MKTILYLNGKVGIWMQFERGICINLHAEPLIIESVPYKPCAWLTSKRQLVHLVIDSEHAEIDAYPLKRSGTALQQISNRWALRNSLINRFPGAIIRAPEKQTGLDALLVQQLHLSELCRVWLAYVENSAVTFCSVTTCEESIAKLFANSDRAYLVVSHVLGYCKHTFCCAGHALFSRTLECASDSSVTDALQETVSHLRATELIDAAVQTYSIGLTNDQISAVAELEYVDKHVVFDDKSPVEFGRESKTDDITEKYNAVIHIARQADTQSKSNPFLSKRYVTWALTKYARLIRYRRSLVQLVFIVTMAVLSVAFCGSVQWQKNKEQQEYAKNKSSLLLSVEYAKQALHDESPDGLALSDAILKSQVLKASSGPSPEVLLTTIATVFTEHRKLLLQELSWATIEQHADSVGESVYTGQDSTHITSRISVPTEPESVSKVAVSIVGLSNPDASLRDQQDSINALVAMLRRYNVVENLIVLEAPLKRAASDDRIGANALDQSTHFRIQFQMDRRPPHEV